ncbi:MAG: histidine kinase [Limisphaerales bacterium]
MKDKLNKLSQRYVVALRKHLGKGAGTASRPALQIGRSAVALGLETLQLASIHEKALVALKLSPTAERLDKRAQIFFAEALIPIVETHRFVRQSKSDAIRLNKNLGRRTAELTDSNRLLQRGIVRHKTMEATLKKSGERYMELLQNSLQLQEGLRQLARKGLTAQEAERKKMSHELQDEVAQLLLSINVRLLSLRRGGQGNTKSLKNQIASTQRLVSQSVKSVREVVSDLDSHQYE